MRLPLFSRRLGALAPAGDRIVRFRRLLTSALSIQRYWRHLRQAGLNNERAIAAVSDIEATLALMPVLDLDRFATDPEAFENRKAPAAGVQRFANPMPQRSRIAILAPGFEQRNGVQEFKLDGSPESLISLGQFQPEIMAASLGTLLSLARMIDNGAACLAPPTHAVVAFTGIGYGTLEPADRDMLWQVFRTPLFEHHAGPDGKVIACECEVHEGLHLVPENAALETHDGGLLMTSLTDLRRPVIRLNTGHPVSIETAACDCGRTEPRLIAAAPKPVPALSRAAVA